MLIGEISPDIKNDKNQRLVTFPLLRNYKPYAKHSIHPLVVYMATLLVD